MKENYCWQLQVSDDGRSIVKSDGSPWFWLGDTAWDLFIRSNREDLHKYFRNRQEKGFTVIQGVLLMGYHVDFNTPNIYSTRMNTDKTDFHRCKRSAISSQPGLLIEWILLNAIFQCLSVPRVREGRP